MLEHTYDPLGALAKMTTALNSEGVLAHNVDLRDHGMFSAHDHESKYLEVPDWVYPFMTSSVGRPNRVLFHMYRAAVQHLPLHCTFYVTRLAAVGDIIPHVRYGEIAPDLMQQALAYVRHVRRSFAKSLRGLAAEDLAVTGFFLVARKHSVGGRTDEPTA